jgi:hypothetical protein
MTYFFSHIHITSSNKILYTNIRFIEYPGLEHIIHLMFKTIVTIQQKSLTTSTQTMAFALHIVIKSLSL